MSTLDAQKARLIEEINEAEIQISAIKQQASPNLRILNYYYDVMARNRQMISVLDKHLGIGQQDGLLTRQLEKP